MAFNNLIARSGAQALIPEAVSLEILKNLETESAAMALFRKLPMSTSQTRMPVIAALPTAYFVNGDTGMRQTTEVDWANKFLNVEEISCIVPIPKNVVADVQDGSGFDIWGTIRPLIEQAVARTLDAAVFFGVNKPQSWPSAIAVAAAALGNKVTHGANTQAKGGIAQDIADLFGLVENGGYAPNGHVTQMTFKKYLRAARDTMGQKLLDVSTTELDGSPIRYAMPGLWPSGSGAVEFITGDFSQGILGTRADISFDMLTEAVIQDNTGAIIYNLAQQNMVAMKVDARFAFQVANTINYQQQNEANRYPFALLQAA